MRRVICCVPTQVVWTAQLIEEIGKFPLIIRPAFTLGGTGGGIAYNMDEYDEIVHAGLAASLTSQARPLLGLG